MFHSMFSVGAWRAKPLLSYLPHALNGINLPLSKTRLKGVHLKDADGS
jgi:hypothetical protein